MPHYVILSPLEAPITYAFFGLTWISCLISIWISCSFFRRNKGAWWLLVASALALPLIFEITICLSHGLPPLPYRLVYPEQNETSPDRSLASRGPREPLQTENGVILSVSRVQWSFFPPMMALALIWAYRDDRKKRAPSTA